MPLDRPSSPPTGRTIVFDYDEKFAASWEQRDISSGDSNAGIKKCLRRLDTYVSIANSDPTAFWYHMAVEPAKHACSLIYLSKAPYTDNEARRSGLEALGSKLFSNILSLERIYRNAGLVGLKIAAIKHPDKISADAIKSYTARDAFKQGLKELASQNSLNWKDENALGLALAKPELMAHAKASIKYFTYHEQKFAQPLYDAKWGSSGVTLKEAMDLKSYPAMQAFATTFSLTTIKLGSRRLDFSDIQLGNLNDRLAVADAVSDTSAILLSDPTTRHSFLNHRASINTPFMHTPHDADEARFRQIADGVSSALGVNDIRVAIGHIFYPNHMLRTKEYDEQVKAFVEHNFTDTFSRKKENRKADQIYDLFPIDRFLLRLKREIGSQAPDISSAIDSILSETDPQTRYQQSQAFAEENNVANPDSQTATLWANVLGKYSGQEVALSEYLRVACFGEGGSEVRHAKFSEDPDIQVIIQQCNLTRQFTQPSQGTTPKEKADDLQQRQREFLERQERLETFQACLQTASFLQTLGERTNCPELVQGGAVLKLGLTTVNSIAELTGKDFMPEALGKLGKILGPISAVASCVLDVLGAFGVFGPSANEMIMEQLKQISHQIHDMHVEMHQNFQNVFKCFSQIFVEFQRTHAFLAHLSQQNEQILDAIGQVDTRLCDQNRINEIRKLKDLLSAIERNARANAHAFFAEGPHHKKLNKLLTTIEEHSFSPYLNGFNYLAPATDSTQLMLTAAITKRALGETNPYDRLAVVAACAQETMRRFGEGNAQQNHPVLSLSAKSMLNPGLWHRTVPALRAYVKHSSPHFDLEPSVIQSAARQIKTNATTTISFAQLTRDPKLLKVVFKRYTQALVKLSDAQSDIIKAYSEQNGVSELSKTLSELINEQEIMPADTTAKWNTANAKTVDGGKWNNPADPVRIDIKKTFASMAHNHADWQHVLKMCGLAKKWEAGDFDNRFSVYQLTDQYANTSFYVNIGFKINGSDQLYSLVNAVYTGYRYCTISSDWNVAYCPQAPDNTTNPNIKAVKPIASNYTPPPAFLGANQCHWGKYHDIVVTSPHQSWMPGKYSSNHLSPDLKFTHGNLENKNIFKDSLEKAYQAHRVNIAKMMVDPANPAYQTLAPSLEEIDAARLVLLALLHVADIDLTTEERDSFLTSNQYRANLQAIIDGNTALPLSAFKQAPRSEQTAIENNVVNKAESGFTNTNQLYKFCEEQLKILEQLPAEIRPSVQASSHKAVDPRDEQIKQLEAKIDNLTNMMAAMMAMTQQSKHTPESFNSSSTMCFSSRQTSSSSNSSANGQTPDEKSLPEKGRKITFKRID